MPIVRSVALLSSLMWNLKALTVNYVIYVWTRNLTTFNCIELIKILDGTHVVPLVLLYILHLQFIDVRMSNASSILNWFALTSKNMYMECLLLSIITTGSCE
jgi:hypothetical protein